MQAGAATSAATSGTSQRSSTFDRSEQQLARNFQNESNKRVRLHEDSIDWGRPSPSPSSGPAEIREPSPKNLTGRNSHQHGAVYQPKKAEPAVQSAATTPTSGQQQRSGKPALVEADIDWDDGMSAPPASSRAAPKPAFNVSRHVPDAKPSNPSALLEAQRGSGVQPQRQPPSYSSSLLTGPNAVAPSTGGRARNHGQQLATAGREHERIQQALGHTAAVTRDIKPDAQQATQKGPSSLVKRQMDTIHRLKAAEAQRQGRPSVPRAAPKVQAKPAVLPVESDIDW